MKLSFSLFVLLGASANAFVTNTNGFGRPSFGLSMSVDSSDAVKAAMEASEKFGKTSPEARMAWELVEELDASNRYEMKKKEREKIYLWYFLDR